MPFLYNAFGIEMAARTYFDKSADQLDVLESATLVGMLKGTSYYNPVLNPERALRAPQHGAGADGQARQAASRRASRRWQRGRCGWTSSARPSRSGPAPHVAQQLRKWLIAWADRNGYDIYADGLVVRTTLDSRLQKAANQAVARQMAQLQALADRAPQAGEERALLQAGFLALDPRSGHVRAWVGSRDFAQDQFDHVSQARRQPGSTFKPFVYGAAFEQGMRPTDTLHRPAGDDPRPRRRGLDARATRTPPTGQPMTPARRPGAVARTRITAQVMQQVGPARVAELAQRHGRAPEQARRGAVAGAGHQPGDAARDGGGLRHHRQRRQLHRAGAGAAHRGPRRARVLEAFVPAAAEQAMPRPQALTLVDVMRGVVDEGTGAAIRTRFGITGRRGRQDRHHAGQHRRLVHPDAPAAGGGRLGRLQRQPRDHGRRWGQGARSALPMVGDFFQQALRSRWIDARAEFDIPRPGRSRAPR